MVEEPDRPDDVSAMMEDLWGPRTHAPDDALPIGASRRDMPGPRDSKRRGPVAGDEPPATAENVAGDGWRTVEAGLLSRLGKLEARVAALEAALDSQAARTDAALAPVEKIGNAVAGITRVTKGWTGRRKT